MLFSYYTSSSKKHVFLFYYSKIIICLREAKLLAKNCVGSFDFFPFFGSTVFQEDNSVGIFICSCIFCSGSHFIQNVFSEILSLGKSWCRVSISFWKFMTDNSRCKILLALFGVVVLSKLLKLKTCSIETENLLFKYATRKPDLMLCVFYQIIIWNKLTPKSTANL